MRNIETPNFIVSFLLSGKVKANTNVLLNCLKWGIFKLSSDHQGSCTQLLLCLLKL